jgi:hypothetical protein
LPDGGHGLGRWACGSRNQAVANIPKLIAYWLVGFAAYLVIQLISSAFGWTFMFPFWKVKLF